MQNQSKITCPNCGSMIDVQDALSHQLEEEIKRDYNIRLSKEKENYEQQSRVLAEEKTAFEEKKKKENELFQERFDIKIKEERKLLEIKLKAKMQEEQADQIRDLQKELDEKSEKVKELNKSKMEIARLQREKAELADSINAEAQITLNKKLIEEKEKIRKSEQDRNEMAIKELHKQLDDQKRLTEEMKRKQEQGSMQMQGEVQELAIEEWLAGKFPLDSIEEIKKGVRGGDCIQTVNTRTRQNCGTIYYESKRTKDFQPGWIEKFKNDIRERGANLAVLVTEAMPQGMDRMGLKDGIWICTYEEFKGLCVVLRETIIQISDAIGSQENKGEKMHMLYDYLTSNEFKLQIEGIVEGFTLMKLDLESEKRSITGHWKKREKQIEKVLLNTNFMYNSIRGIAGTAIQPIKALEMPEVSEEIEN
ncbi:MAG: Caldesmon [Bacteroidetes bacterium GWF2_41_31]|nr:MAG: Caldesmon [Bacteroidetes bacterium GWF2_41_31]